MQQVRRRCLGESRGPIEGQGRNLLFAMRLQIWKSKYDYNQSKFSFLVFCCLLMWKLSILIFRLQIVVILVIWVISLLVIYMLFLICLDPLLNKRIHKASANVGYHEHNNEEVLYCIHCTNKITNTLYLCNSLLFGQDDSSVAAGTFHPMGERGNVLNRVGHQQDKWKRQVREQRRNIYDRHTMLN